MKNLNQFNALNKNELKTINGGCQIGDCWPNPLKPKKPKHIIVIQ